MQPFLPLIAGRRLVVVYSHADWDHVWGTAGLPYGRARIIAHERGRARFASDVPASLAEKQAAEPGAWDDVVLVPPTEGIEQRGTVELGTLSLELHALPGHTPDCLVGFVPERGLLLAGDTAETPFPVVPADSPLPAWIAELERWASDDRVRTVVPAHGRIGGREILLENAAYLRSILHGRPLEPQGVLTPFYRATHAANARWSGGPR
jgi:glyoxylase-like metal-dependent hydrolase (beta-lactamase superfamily II)